MPSHVSRPLSWMTPSLAFSYAFARWSPRLPREGPPFPPCRVPQRPVFTFGSPQPPPCSTRRFAFCPIRLQHFRPRHPPFCLDTPLHTPPPPLLPSHPNVAFPCFYLNRTARPRRLVAFELRHTVPPAVAPLLLSPPCFPFFSSSLSRDSFPPGRQGIHFAHQGVSPLLTTSCHFLCFSFIVGASCREAVGPSPPAHGRFTAEGGVAFPLLGPFFSPIVSVVLR